MTYRISQFPSPSAPKLSITTSNSSLQLADGPSHSNPEIIVNLIASKFLTQEIQDKYAHLIQLEREALLARQAWTRQLAEELSTNVQAFVDALPNTHPELFIWLFQQI